MTTLAIFDQLEWRGGTKNHRGSNSRSATILEGDPNSLNNYWLAIVRMGDHGGSPWHRHDFDQMRYPLQGPHPYTPKDEVPVGWVGYFPEGVPYGPFDQIADREYLILQCGGASGCGYLSREGWRRATAELSERGQFKNGFYEFVSAEGKPRRKDALEAVLEHARSRPVVYPIGRYKTPVLINPEAYEWLPLASGLGVQERLLATLSERGTAVGQLRLEPGATYTIPGDQRIRLYFVTRGNAEVNEGRLPPKSAFSVEPSDSHVQIHCDPQASEPAEFLVFFLPDLHPIAN